MIIIYMVIAPQQFHLASGAKQYRLLSLSFRNVFIVKIREPNEVPINVQN